MVVVEVVDVVVVVVVMDGVCAGVCDFLHL